jgi:hypothetical protein
MARNEEDKDALTLVGNDIFEEPVSRIGVSGGTAPFFTLKLLNPEEGKKPTYYIGKDLSRATDEVSFYEQVKNSEAARDALGGLCDYLFPYRGILKTKEKGTESEVDLLVLQNLHDGKKKLRLLDIKMGEKTASANWQGKSRLRAFKQRIFDEITNSTKEGYRLEGFDGAPVNLNKMETLVESLSKDKSSKSSKKSRRLLFQNLTGKEILQHLLDLHIGPEETSETYSVDEYLEVVMHEILQLLVKLAVFCCRVNIPQKWIGSSLAIGFDSGQLPLRSASEEDIRESVIVKIFDWGRSELNTSIKMQELKKKEIADRTEFWNDYKRGIYTLSWIASNKYFNRFCCEEWDIITFSIYDFDSLSGDDFMCEATVSLKVRDRTEIPLKRKSGKDGGTLSYSIDWSPAAAGSRLRGSWKVNIFEGKNLPNKDISVKGNTSDPYVIVEAKSNNQKFSLDQMTSIIQEDINPVWNETLTIPTSITNDAMQAALESAGLDCNSGTTSASLDAWITRIEGSTMPGH